jgi:hypothetical protein
MIYLDHEKLDQFFKSVAGGFATPPREVLLFFVMLAVILSFLIIFYLVQRRGMHRKLSRQSAERYAELIDQHKLSDAEVRLIEGLSEYLPAEKQKYLLLTNQHLFNGCAGKLQANEPVSESTLASTRLKLGFRVEQPEEIKQYQRRNYYRRKTHLSVFVTPLHTGGETYRSTLLDLGGGGASLGNPQSLFKAGDLLELSFSSGASDFRLPAEVVRISRNASVLHVQFRSIAESARDRIIGSLYRITDL